MSEKSGMGLSAIVIILLTGVMATGFYMNGQVAAERTDQLTLQVTNLATQVAEVQAQVTEVRNATVKGAAAAAAPAAAAAAPAAEAEKAAAPE